MKSVLHLFHDAAKRVPAYKDFLRKNGVRPDKVTTWENFQHIPPVSRANYLRQYPLEQLCWDGTFQDMSLVFTATSGSTGEPFYFPRNDAIDRQSAMYHELFLKNVGTPKASTLVIIAFGMGVWIGGIITYQAFKYLSQKGYSLTILTPGVNKKEIFAALKHIAPSFGNVIICAYPPFLKDIIDEGKRQGVDWKKFNLRIVCAAEAFSEKFRDYIVRKAHLKNPLTDIMNIYGSADIGTMAEESPVSILIRRMAVANKKLHTALFPLLNRLPTFAQFNPEFIQFEAVNKNIYLTGDSALPLIRYEIGDHGGVLSYDEVTVILKKHGIDLAREARKAGITKTILKHPFVYIYERADLSTKLYGAIIYPEHVKEGISHPSLEDSITGKFTMMTKHDPRQNEFLEINIELKPDVVITESLEKKIGERISTALLEHNAEHRNNAGMMGDRVKPQLKFWNYEHPEHFRPGIKQKWVKK
ncbi:MAG: hypothetical protein AAB420_03980 [Patescibacteria group bacterium]|mgnify:CR=1 FL=1